MVVKKHPSFAVHLTGRGIYRVFLPNRNGMRDVSSIGAPAIKAAGCGTHLLLLMQFR
jgi:hypothetical protein